MNTWGNKITGINVDKEAITLYFEQRNGKGGEILFTSDTIYFQPSGKIWTAMDTNLVVKYVIANNKLYANGIYNPTRIQHFFNKVYKVFKPNLAPFGYKELGYTDRAEIFDTIMAKFPELLNTPVVIQERID